MDACFMTYTTLIRVIKFPLDVGFNATKDNIKTLNKTNRSQCNVL